MMVVAGSTGSPCSTRPVTGSSQVTKASSTDSAPPRPIEKIDRTTSGRVMSQPDSWGWTAPSRSFSVVQRREPWKIMKNRRDM